MNGGRAITRLALRGAWRERRAMIASATFVAMALALGIVAIGWRDGGSEPQVRVVVHGRPGAVETEPPAVRSGPAGAVAVTAFGDAYTALIQASDLRWRPAGRIAGTSFTVPGGSRVVTYRQAPMRLLAGGRAVDVTTADLDPRASHADVGIAVTSGRRPTGADEVAVSHDVASALRVRPGDEVTFVSGPMAGRRTRVTGLVVERGPNAPSSIALLSPDALLGTMHDRVFEASIPGLQIAGGSGGGGTVNQSDGPASGSLEVSYRGPVTVGAWGLAVALYLGTIESLAMFLPFLLATAILAAGMQRRARELRLLVLAGAGPAALARAAVVRGLVIAVVAAPIAIAIAIVVSRMADTSLSLGWLSLTIPFVPAVVACVAASLEAARVAQHAGRDASYEPVTLRRSLVRGGIAVAAAVLIPLLAAMIVGASWLAVIGLLAAVVAVRFLAPVAVWLPGLLPLPRGARAAARSVARARWVSAPAASGVALASVLGLLVLVASTSSTYASSHVPRLDVVAILPGTLADAAGSAIAPEAVVRGLVPDAVATVPIWRTDVCSGDACTGLDAWAIRPADADAVGIGGTRLGTTAAPANLHASDPHWPALVPGIFAAATGTPAGTPSWLIRLPRDLSASEARSLSRRARDAGLELAAGDRDPTAIDGLTVRGQLAISGITALLALGFGAAATILVLAERREETRRLLLAGGRPRDCRIAAAFTALVLGAASVLLSALLFGLVTIAAAVAGGPGDGGLAALVAAFAGLLAVPFVLAGGVLILWRTPRSLGRAGRSVRDASTALR